MRQGRIESESEIHFFPLGNENDIGSKSQNENPFCGQSENPFCSSVGNGNSFCSLGKSEKGKCGRAEIGHTAHAAKVQIVRIIQMNSRSEHKKMLDRRVWGNALPSHTHTITSCLLRFITRSWKPSHLVFDTRSWQSDQKIMAFRFLGLAHRCPSVRLFPLAGR